jgi:hypothetical protein
LIHFGLPAFHSFLPNVLSALFLVFLIIRLSPIAIVISWGRLIVFIFGTILFGLSLFVAKMRFLCRLDKCGGSYRFKREQAGGSLRLRRLPARTRKSCLFSRAPWRSADAEQNDERKMACSWDPPSHLRQL